MSEVRTGGVPFLHSYTYDHNGNRLTQTSGGQPSQSFVYDAHDKLLSGNGGGETYGYDPNGNQTGLSYYGSVYAYTFDDEDRLTAVTGPNGLNDAFAYNGLGQRVAKTDSTGQYALVSDGASPAAPVLADGLTVYTPGLSSRKNGASAFRHGDLLGSLRFETDANQNVVANRLYSGFGAAVSSSGDPWTPLGWVGDGASQTDADTGLVLMGHRVYDSRLGRFISQDPAGDGDNWYAYADNDPINGADPDGLFSQGMPSTDQTLSHDNLMGFMGGFEFGGYGGAGSYTVTKYTHDWTDVHNGSSAWEHEPGSDTYSQESFTFGSGGSGMGGFMMGAAGMRPPGMPNRTWKQALLGTLGAMGAALTLSGGAVHPAAVPHEVTPVAVEQAKSDKREEKEEKSSGSLYSLMRSTHKAYLATQNFLDSITYQIGRLQNQSGGLGVPIFSGAGGVLAR